MSNAEASDAEAYERTVKLKQMEAGIELKQRQSFWETPRNLAILVATVAALCAAEPSPHDKLDQLRLI